MKVAISALGTDLKAKLDPKFGRAHGFIIVETDSGETHHYPNDENIQLAQGAGIKTAQFVADMGVVKVVSGHFGPKAASVLEKADIEMVNGDPSKTIEEIIKEL